jgi:hypothetical protein
VVRLPSAIDPIPGGVCHRLLASRQPRQAQNGPVPGKETKGDGPPSVGAVMAGSGAVGLAPMLVYWVAGLIRQAFRHKREGRRSGSRPFEEGERHDRREAAPPG